MIVWRVSVVLLLVAVCASQAQIQRRLQQQRQVPVSRNGRFLSLPQYTDCSYPHGLFAQLICSVPKPPQIQIKVHKQIHKVPQYSPPVHTYPSPPVHTYPSPPVHTYPPPTVHTYPPTTVPTTVHTYTTPKHTYTTPKPPHHSYPKHSKPAYGYAEKVYYLPPLPFPFGILHTLQGLKPQQPSYSH